MSVIDKNYLLLQFKVRISSKKGTEFQGFFEDIMEEAFPDFQKIRPYGNKGDGGNDGYREEAGIYYQVYAPETPKINESKAASKLKNDFERLKKEWNKISEIKEYYFVFNDKYLGSTQELEKTMSQLRKNNPNITFDTFLAKDLEKLFFSLDETDILNLGFDISSRKAISNAYEYLQKIEIELDRENAKLAQRMLENIKDVISELNADGLSFEHEILECRCLQKLEKIDAAKEKYENISTRFPDDPRSFLYLAEIYLLAKDYKKNKELLEKAKSIDCDYWLLKLEELVRKIHLEDRINVENINEKSFPDDPRTKANFYRLYAHFLEDSGDKAKADSFIEKAINLNPNRFSNYVERLSLMEMRMLSNNDISQGLRETQILLEETEGIKEKFSEYGDIGPRNKAILNFKKLNALYIHIQENFSEFEKVAEETFKLALTCYFDKQIEQIFTGLLMFVFLPDNDFNRLLEYLKQSKKGISDELSRVIILQFSRKSKLFTEGKKYFAQINNDKHLDFINALESENFEKISNFLKDDIRFAINIAMTLKNLPNLSRKIIEILPEDKNIQKDKYLAYIYFSEKNYDKAFEILKDVDLENLDYFECKHIFKIAQEKKAWDFEVIILEKILEKEKDKKEIFNFKIQLFNAYLNLRKYPEVIRIGEELLEQDLTENILDKKNKEALVAQTIFACFERGKAENKYFEKSNKILESYQPTEPSFEFKVSVEAEVYLNNNKPDKALESLIEGVKIKKNLIPEEYARLFLSPFTEVCNQINIKLESLNKIEENTFVKLKNEDRWYFVGTDNELDAIKTSETHTHYSLFINKKLGDKILFENKYGSEHSEKIIEYIFTIERYILWQASHNFKKLAELNVLEGVQRIEMPRKGETIDPKYLLKFLKDINKEPLQVFEMYCKNIMPLSILAVSEGGLINAIGRIQHEDKGFINSSTGTIEELEKQKNIAKKVIDKKMPFYIDGTSALVLAETGIFKKLYSHLPNLKISQSVINFLIDTSGKFRYIPGQAGHMGYSKGRIIFTSLEQDRRDIMQSSFLESIKLFESKPKNITDISLANKRDCFSEQKVPEELCDACILAQKENLPILTEDFLYLKMNELETKKGPPEYFSSLLLLKVLYEQGQVSFNDYLDFFAYLSSHRFRFLSLNHKDIEKAVLGDGRIKVVNTKNIRKLNFPLTLSEEYGVRFQDSFMVVVRFLYEALVENSVTSGILVTTFIEIVEVFPTKMNKRNLGQMLFEVCRKTFEKSKPRFIFFKNRTVEKKLAALAEAIEIFDSSTKL